MKFSLRALLVSFVFLALFLVLLRVGPTGDIVLDFIILGVVVAMSVVSVTLTIVHGGTYGQHAVVPGWFRRWLLGEPDRDEPDRRK